MIAKHFSKIKNLFKFTLLFCAVAFLSYCTTSPKTASNFGKRKYTHGHFSDRVAKVKMEYKPYDEQNISPNTHANPSSNSGNSQFSTTSDKKDVSPTFNAKALKTVAPSRNQPIQESNTIAKSPSAGSTNTNISLKENSGLNAYPYVEQGHPYEHGGGDHSSGLLLGWVLCLALSVLCWLLLIGLSASIGAGTASGGIGAGCFLIIFGSFAFVAAIVLFILWIIAISK